MTALRAMIVANLKMSFRNRSALFWWLAFPVIFIVLFGYLFSGGEFTMDVGVVGAEQSPVTAQIVERMREQSGFEVRTGERAAELRALENGQRRVVVIFGPGAGAHQITAEIYFDRANPQLSRMAVAAVQQFLSEANAAMVGAPRLIEVSVEGVDAEQFRYIDFLVPGVLAMSIMNNGMIGLSSAFVTYRERGILRRIRATPFPLIQFIVARISTQVIIAVVQAVVLLAVALALFQVTIAGDLLSLLAMIVLGSLAFLALGFFISGIARNTEVSDSLSNALTFPMLFLGGVFFPVDSAPAWLQPITRIIPLTYLANGLRDIMVRGETVVQVWPEALIMLATALIGLLLAVRFFRWESRSV